MNEELTPIEFEDQLMDLIEADDYDGARQFANEQFDESWPIDEQLRLMRGILHYLAMAGPVTARRVNRPANDADGGYSCA